MEEQVLSEFEEELHILAAELSKINFFMVLCNEFMLIGTYRTKEQLMSAFQDKEKNAWTSIYEVPVTELQDTIEEFGKIYCPELRVEYTNVLELLRDLKVFSLASLIE